MHAPMAPVTGPTARRTCATRWSGDVEGGRRTPVTDTDYPDESLVPDSAIFLLFSLVRLAILLRPSGRAAFVRPGR